MSSVRKNQRKESKRQFEDTARELVVHTLAYAKKLPKSAMFLLTKDIVDLSRNIYKCVICANKFYPSTKLDIDERYKLFKMALGYIDTLDCFLGLAKDAYGGMRNAKSEPIISEYGWLHWGELLDKESNLIKAVLTSDAKIVL